MSTLQKSLVLNGGLWAALHTHRIEPGSSSGGVPHDLLWFYFIFLEFFSLLWLVIKIRSHVSWAVRLWADISCMLWFYKNKYLIWLKLIDLICCMVIIPTTVRWERLVLKTITKFVLNYNGDDSPKWGWCQGEPQLIWTSQYNSA